MKLRLSALLTCLFFVAPLIAQEHPSAPAKGAELDAPDAERQLPVYDPFYVVYQNQWYASMGVTEQRYVFKAGLPAQTVSGVPYAASSTEYRDIDVRASAMVRYGFTDRVSAFIAGNYLADRDTSSVSSGLVTSSASNLPRTGLMNPHLGLVGRILGVNRNSWYLDVAAVFTPGIRSGDKNQIASPLNTYEGGIRVGRNMGNLTFGMDASLAYSPETNYNNITYRQSATLVSDAFVQYNFGPIFANGQVAFLKYLDSYSNTDAFNSKVRTIITLELGTAIGANGFAKIGYGWLLPVSTDYSTSGFTLRFEDKGGPLARLEVGVRF